MSIPLQNKLQSGVNLHSHKQNRLIIRRSLGLLCPLQTPTFSPSPGGGPIERPYLQLV